MKSKGTRIHTIEELLGELRNVPGQGGYLDVLRRADIPTTELLPQCSWNPKHYTRNLLARTPEFELFLICYEKEQRTSIHDFDSQEAWIHPILGEVTEERYALGKDGALVKVNETVLTPATFSYQHNGTSIHRFINTFDGRTVTLNLYAKPLRKWKVYDEGDARPHTVAPGK